MAVSKITIKTAPENLILPQNQEKLHPLHKNCVTDPNSSINTVEKVSSNDILQATLRSSTILKYITHAA